MVQLLIIPFLLQGLLMFVDEFYFHHKRGLPLWERLGHPLDTLTTLACYVFILMNEPSTNHILIYIGLACFSCLFVTKDEFVHAQECKAPEIWLHSILFILHPITFLVAAIIWAYPIFSLQNQSLLFSALKGQTLLIVCFLIYQIIYWSFYGKKIDHK